MKLDDIIRVCHMATNPLYVLVSHLEQARKDRRRQMKAAHLRTSQINENAKAKKRQRRKERVHSNETHLNAKCRSKAREIQDP
jgi:hypothetical protein